MRRIIERIRAGLAAATPAGSGAGAADDPDPGIRYVLADPVDEAKPRTLITFLGELPENIGEILNSVAVACQLRGEYPVAAMSELKPDLIAVSPVPIEFIPTSKHLPVKADEYERYVHRRWSLLLAKWNITKQIDLNMEFEEFVVGQIAREEQAIEVAR